MTALCEPARVDTYVPFKLQSVNMLKSTLLIACVDIYLLLLFTLKYNKELLMAHLNHCKLGGLGFLR